MKRIPLCTAAFSAFLVACSPVSARQGPPVPVNLIGESAAIPYAQVARLALESDIVLDATIRSVARIAPAEAPGLAPGHVRFYSPPMSVR